MSITSRASQRGWKRRLLPSSSSPRSNNRWIVLLYYALIIILIVVVNGEEPPQDLYKLLGVSRSATTKEIKSAYRKKALDTHPDKNKDVDPEVAAAEFHKVVHAFEILSDSTSRKRYDRTGRTDEETNNNFNAQRRSQGGGGFHFNFHFNQGRQRQQYRKPQLKDKFEVKRAQSRVMHIVSLEQLKTVMLDDNGKLERNLLLCFVTPGKVETIADDQVVFPYPFASKSSNGIWWEDLVQTVKIRFHYENELSKFFGVPNGPTLQQSGKPMFLYGKRGQSLLLAENFFARHTASTHNEFHTWVWKQLEVSVGFFNGHSHPVELFWIHGSKAQKKFDIAPGQTAWQNTMLSHEWWFRDARVDTFPGSPGRGKLSKDSSLGSFTILSDEEGQIITIEPKTCMDFSGHCSMWRNRGECYHNPKFMNDKCKLTCLQCDPLDDIKRKNVDSSKRQQQQQQNHDEL